MKKRLPIILILLAAGAGFYYWNYVREANPDGRLRVSGNLELTMVDMSFKTAGRLVELSVKEGDSVKAGQVIARIDPVQLEAQKARDLAIVSTAQSSYEQLQTSIAFQKATIESDIAARRAEVEQAQAHLADLRAGSRRQEIDQAQAAVSEARAQLEFARTDWDRAQTLYRNQDISTAQYDQSRTKFNAATAVVAQAEHRLELVKEGPRKEEIVGAEAQVARGQAGVKMAEANRLELQRKEQELTARKAEIERARAQAGISQAQLNDTVITAPLDGVVLVKSAELGEVVAAGTTVISIGAVAHPWMRAYIGETDLGKVKIGSKALLTTDSFPNKHYEGVVSFISSEAEFTPKQIQTKEERVKLVYRIKVDVDNSSGELKNNMPVDAEIIL